MTTNNTTYFNSDSFFKNLVWARYNNLPFHLSLPQTCPSISLDTDKIYRNMRLPNQFNSFSEFFSSASETFLGKFIIAPLSAIGLRMQTHAQCLMTVAKEISASGKPLHLLKGTSSLFRRDLLFLPASIPAVEAMRDSMIDPSDKEVVKIAKSPIFDAGANGILSYAWNYFRPITSITTSPLKTIFQTFRQYGLSGFSKSMGPKSGRIAIAQALFSGFISSVENLVTFLQTSKQKK